MEDLSRCFEYMSYNSSLLVDRDMVRIQRAVALSTALEHVKSN